MEPFLERLLLELAALALQFAIVRIVNWILETWPSSEAASVLAEAG